MDMLDYIFRYVMHIDGITNTENYVLYVTEPLHARMVAKWREGVVPHNAPKETTIKTFCGHLVEVVAGDGEMFWFAERIPTCARDLSDEPFTDHVEFRCSECGVWIAEIFGGNAFDGGGFNFCPGCGRKIIK